MSDSPRGDLDMDDEVGTLARYREYESIIVARQRTSLATVALERSSGRLVAYTELNVPDLDPSGRRAAGHHRRCPSIGDGALGSRSRSRTPSRSLTPTHEAETVQTSNASENEHMIAVNEALGFRSAERSTIWQLKLAPSA